MRLNGFFGKLAGSCKPVMSEVKQLLQERDRRTSAATESGKKLTGMAAVVDQARNAYREDPRPETLSKLLEAHRENDLWARFGPEAIQLAQASGGAVEISDRMMQALRNVCLHIHDRVNEQREAIQAAEKKHLGALGIEAPEDSAAAKSLGDECANLADCASSLAAELAKRDEGQRSVVFQRTYAVLEKYLKAS